MTAQTFSAPLETLRKRVQEATQRLLGDTIGISDDAWNALSKLPGWSRAHVAAHLAAGADALAGVIVAAVEGRSVPLYPDAESRRAGIERGSSLTGLELQICLDTSAGRLERAMDTVDDWSVPVQLLGRPMTLAHLPMARLSEVVVHHLDLDCDFDVDRIDPGPARWLLQWALLWQPEHADLPALRVASDSGVVADLGEGEQRRPISGPDASLWGWLMGRSVPVAPQGADDLALPLRS
ncbi:maleylpyruvate isomerase family mycothiol-dependent enzyme [Micropruina sp.]|uniref:maleylpyruvate isomerase family mycothiol-dependent enzyme n=1 Tax=Micropruina sp. TaxID=2737536 RepID=UPI0039E65410